MTTVFKHPSELLQAQGKQLGASDWLTVAAGPWMAWLLDDSEGRFLDVAAADSRACPVRWQLANTLLAAVAGLPGRIVFGCDIRAHCETPRPIDTTSGAQVRRFVPFRAAAPIQVPGASPAPV